MGNRDDMIRRAAQAAQRGQQQGVTVAAPLNDIQLVALMAAIIGAADRETVTPAQAVSQAIEVVAQAIVSCRGGDLARAQQRLVEPHAESVGN